MSKTKSVSKPSKSDGLSKVKDSGIAKASKDTKSKTIAKEVAAKEDKKSKKNKKVVKEPTPEPSDSEDSEDSVSESESESASESDSSSEDEPAPKVVAGKKNGVKVAAKKEPEPSSDSSSESDDSDSDSDADTTPAAGVLGKAPAVDAVSSDESDSSDDDEEEAAPKTNGAKSNGVKASKDDESDSDSADSASSEDDDSEDDEAEKPAPKANKRKAEEDDDSTAKKAKTEAPAGNTNLFLGNLSWNVNDEWLQEEFSPFGELSGARVVMDRDSGRSKGFGYVEFVNSADAAKAYAAKKGTELDGREINLDWASARPDNSNKQDDRRKSYGDQISEPSDTLFCGNLSFDMSQEQVGEAFSSFGTIISVRLPTDQSTGMAKGFGYVTFSSVDEAKAGLEGMQGAYLGSRPIRLDYSQPRPDRQDGGFGGRGGGGRGGFGGRGGGRGFGGRGGDRGRGGRGSFGGRGDRGGRGGRGASTNRGGFGDFQGKRQTFD